MSILINKSSKIVVQGITGRSGLFHTQQCRAYGSNIVAGVTPGKGGIHIEGIPVFNTVAEAVKYTEANVSMIFVPPPVLPTPYWRLQPPAWIWRSASRREYRCATWCRSRR